MTQMSRLRATTRPITATHPSQHEIPLASLQSSCCSVRPTTLIARGKNHSEKWKKIIRIIFRAGNCGLKVREFVDIFCYRDIREAGTLRN